MSVYEPHTCSLCGQEFFHTHHCTHASDGRPAHVDIDGTLHLLCKEHNQLYFPGQTCSRCAQRQRDERDILEARIADLEERLLRTNRIVAELVKRIQRDQAAHNALARATERLQAHVDEADRTAADELIHGLGRVETIPEAQARRDRVAARLKALGYLAAHWGEP